MIPALAGKNIRSPFYAPSNTAGCFSARAIKPSN